MTHQKATGRRLIIVIACITALLSQFVLPASADVTSVSGGAYGASITSSLLGTVLPPTPSVTLPSGGGGPFTATAVPIVIPGVLSVGVLDVLTEGGNLGAHEGFAHSEADVADVVVGSLLGPNLQIQAVHSECLSNGDGSSGLTRLVGVAGAAGFPELPAPNSVVPQADLPAGIAEIRLNEQIIQNQTGATSITVNAVRITLLPDPVTGAVLEVILAQSRCGAFGPDVNTGQVAVIKDAPADAQDVQFTFTITCPGMAGSPFTRTVTGDGTSDPVINVPTGTQCTVTETPVAGFVEQPPQTAPAVASGATSTVTFVNTRVADPTQTGSVAVIKDAPDDAQNVQFTFTITCPGVAGSPFTRTVTGDGTTTAVTGLPVGTVCTVAETPVAGFVNQPNQTFTAVAAGTTRTVTFVNTRTTTTDPTAPTIRVEKSVNPTSRPQPGGIFQFTVRVTNTGTVPVVVTSITDDVHGNLDNKGTCDTGATLAAGASYTCTFSVQFTGNSGATETDKVTVTAVDAGGRSVTAVSNAVTIKITDPGTPVVRDREPQIIINNNNEVTCVSNATSAAGEYRIAQVTINNENSAECTSTATSARATPAPTPSVSPSTAPPPTHKAAPSGKVLARTGVDTLALTALAVALMAAGSLMISKRATGRLNEL